ncbi:hypothetical protein [Bacillus phage CM1]|nr:hypothetical protein [Bacillus phage CM1]
MTVVVVNGWFDNGNADTIYAGHDIQAAKAVVRESPRDEFELQVWVSGILVGTYASYDGKRWEVTYNKIEKAKQDIERLREKLDKVEKEFELFKDVTLFEGAI